MLYFAVLGKTPEISLTELEYTKPQNIKEVRNNIITFETDFPDRLKKLGGVIKWGSVVEKEEMLKQIEGKKTIGINDENLGKMLKREHNVKRYKLTKLFHTDREVKEKGIEVIQINKDQFGIVQGYQDIQLYEVIDFEKPARSMRMGMMPGKLAHMMLNIGLSNLPHSILEGEAGVTIYDPFVGSGTTGFLANHFGFDFFGSDIDTSFAQENATRWMTDRLCTPEKSFKIFKQDITKPIDDLKNYTGDKKILIVSEGRLGPMITDSSEYADIQNAQSKVLKLYLSFIERLQEIGDDVVAVFTIPYYLGHDNTLEARLQEKINTYTDSKLSLTTINEVYSRKKQKVGRKIMIIK